MAEVTTRDVWFLAVVLIFIPLTATSVTWTAPPPAWTATDPNVIRTVHMPVRNGSTQVALGWTYTLSAGLVLKTIRFSINNDGIGQIIHATGDITVFNKNDYRTRFNISRSEVATLIINKVTEREEAVHQCELRTNNNAWKYRIRVIVTVPVQLTNVSNDQTVREGSDMMLVCEATGRPDPKITWTRVVEDGSNSEVLHNATTWNFANINRTISGTYCCTADSGYGNLASHEVKVNVKYPAKIPVKLKSEYEVAAQEPLTLDCQAERNPQPTYSWTPCDGGPQQSMCDNSKLNVPKVRNKSVYSFTCTVANGLGNDTTSTSVFIAGKVINVTLVITSENCTDGKPDQAIWGKLREKVTILTDLREFDLHKVRKCDC